MFLLAGVLLGILPGVHQNLLALLPLGRRELFELVFGSIFSGIVPTLMFVPSAELAPSLLPGQDLAARGKMGEAVAEYAFGAFLGTLFFVILAPIYPHVVSAVRHVPLFYFLLPLVLFPVFREKNRVPAVALFLLSGVYGYIILHGGSDGVLLAHFSGMFGLTGVLLGEAIPAQSSPVRVRVDWRSALLGAIAGSFLTLFPSLTPVQATAFVFSFLGNPASQISAAGALSTASFLFAFLSLYYTGKGRMASVERIGVFPPEILFMAALAAGFLILLLPALLRAASTAHRFKKAIAAAIVLYTAAFSGRDFVYFLPSFLLGLLPYRLGVNRIHLLGSLSVPTLVWYFGKLK